MITDGTYLELKANFFVEGIPKPQPRQRHFARKTKDGKIIQGCYTPQTGVKEWRERIYWEAKSIRQNNPEMFPLSGPIGLKLIFLFPRLKSLPRRTAHLFIPKTSVPDLDNLIKAVQDALGFVSWRKNRNFSCFRERKSTIEDNIERKNLTTLE